jgi:hypothetical protein
MVHYWKHGPREDDTHLGGGGGGGLCVALPGSYYMGYHSVHY